MSKLLVDEISDADNTGPVNITNGLVLGSSGSISNNSDRIQIQSGVGGDLILGTGSNADAYRFSDAVIYPSVGDATADLGLSNRRFKDLYLSGGVYLGGTGSANKLDDYEEGTWVPTFAGLAAASITTAKYVKVGGLVFFSVSFTTPSTALTNQMYIGGLPFIISADSSASMGYTTSAIFSPAMMLQTYSVYFYKASGAVYTMAEYSAVQIRLSGHYYTTA